MVAGWDEEGGYRPMETLNPGDFFGEIAAITGSPRTANVVAQEPTVVLQVPAKVLRNMMANPHLNRLFLSKMTERMVRMNMLDLPRYGGNDQAALRELCTPVPETAKEAFSPWQTWSKVGLILRLFYSLESQFVLYLSIRFSWKTGFFQITS